VTKKSLIKKISVILIAAVILSIIAAQAAASSDNKVITTKVNSDIAFQTEIIEITNDVGQNYFVNYRIKREQFREEAKEMLNPLLQSDIVSSRKEAQTQWLELSKRIVVEGEVENILKLRGFRDIVAEINNDRAIITVLAKELNSREIKIIKNVVFNSTGLSDNRVEIMLIS